MTLLDFLLEIKTGYGEFILTSDTDEEYGLANIREGKYFKLGGSIWSCNTEKELLDYLEDDPLIIEWLDRDVLEIDAVCDTKKLRDYFEGGYDERAGYITQHFINICVVEETSDEEFWEDEDHLSEPIDVYIEFPTKENWPYAIDVDTFKKLAGLVDEGRARIITNESWADLNYINEFFFFETMLYILRAGADNINKLTEEDIARLEAEAEAQDKDARRQVRIIKYAKDVCNAASPEELLLFFGSYPNIRKLWYRYQ